MAAKFLGQDLTANQIEFFSEDEIVTIIPNDAQLDEDLHFLTGKFGPFTPHLPTKAPLWLALALRSRNLCSIQTPDWLNSEALKSKWETEIAEPNIFEELPFHYIEIASQLLANGTNDVKNSHEVKMVLEDLITLRAQKIAKSFQQNIQRPTTAIKFKHLSLMELNKLRPTIGQALDHMYTIQKQQQQPLNKTSTQASRPYSSTTVFQPHSSTLGSQTDSSSQSSPTTTTTSSEEQQSHSQSQSPSSPPINPLSKKQRMNTQQ